ncbi:MAG: hypothetical protein WCA08_02355 [Desulfoferrobacter sp.]
MAKILLVDDEKHILQYYADELSEAGHEVESLNKGDDRVSGSSKMQSIPSLSEINTSDRKAIKAVLKGVGENHIEGGPPARAAVLLNLAFISNTSISNWGYL